MLNVAKSLTDLRYVLVDMDGVIYRGSTPVPGARDFLRFARQQGIRFLLFTNNSSLTPEQYVAKLAGMGISVRPEEIFTSAQATALYLPELVPAGAPIYVIGEDGLQSALQQGGYRLVADRQVQAVVVGWDRQLNYDKLKLATLAIRDGAYFVATNPDMTFPSEEGIIPGNGAALAALEVSTDTKPIMVGKPERPIFDLALSRLGASREETAMIGDRPETDILGGQRAGLKTILVFSGVTDQARLDASGIEPDWVFEDLGTLAEAWAAL